MLIDTVRQTIQVHDLIHKGDHIVLGLSGGPDSVCLFHVLQRLARDFDLTIHPVHVNHKFRPGAAEQDQAYVEAICAKAGLSCRTFVVDCNALAREQGMTSEEAGRKARYDAFVQVAQEQGMPPCVRIAVAQNANDQAETILHRILRGTGTDGLSGIAYRRDERGIPVIRPLLDVPRKDIEAYCEENDLRPVMDHTNDQPIYTRNRIRLELLPELEQYNENIIETLTRLGRIAAADKEYLWRQSEAAYKRLLDMGGLDAARSAQEAQRSRSGGAGAKGSESAVKGEPACEADDPAGPLAGGPGVVLNRAELADLPEAIRRRVIARAFQDVGLDSDVSEERLRAADAIIGKKQAPKTVQFPRGHKLTVKKGKVFFS